MAWVGLAVRIYDGSWLASAPTLLRRTNPKISVCGRAIQSPVPIGRIRRDYENFASKIIGLLHCSTLLDSSLEEVALEKPDGALSAAQLRRRRRARSSDPRGGKAAHQPAGPVG